MMEASRAGSSHITKRRATLLVSMIVVVILFVSTALILDSELLGESTRLFRLPNRLQTVSSRPEFDTAPTNISHIFFGIGASMETWGDRRLYIEQWWDRDTTRGYAWLDKKLKKPIPSGPVPLRVSSQEWTKFKYSSSQSAIRMARIVLESFRLGEPNVRWFVLGDDDTVFFPENLVSVLSGYDHRQMYYIGGNSESVEQDTDHSYEMAFGGAGIAISYPLASRLANILDGCLDRYYAFYGSDLRISACIDEIGATLTLHRGFHQFDISGEPYGLLAAHPLTPLVSLHHLDHLFPIFPNQTQKDSVKTLMTAYRVDPGRIVQQSFCYEKKQKLSVSVSWGYTVQIYPFAVTAKDLKTPFKMFRTWRTWSEGPYTFNTRDYSPDPCQRPVVYLLDRVEAVGDNETVTSYEMFEGKEGKICISEEYRNMIKVGRVVVSSMKMDDDYWKNAPMRQCCDIMDQGTVKNGTMHIRIRKCRPMETITVEW